MKKLYQINCFLKSPFELLNNRETFKCNSKLDKEIQIIILQH